MTDPLDDKKLEILETHCGHAGARRRTDTGSRHETGGYAR